MYYNLVSSVWPGNKVRAVQVVFIVQREHTSLLYLKKIHATEEPVVQVATRTFDDFAVGLLLAEIGTGVPPYFNPGNDYGSTAEGNLQNEKGIFYILQHKTICDRGQAGLDKSINPKTDLAQGVVPIKQAVKEVVGRSLYYLQHGRHFEHKSATKNGIGNVALLRLVMTIETFF